MWKCGLKTETTLHFLLRCRLYTTITTELLGDLYTVASCLTNYSDEKLVNIFLYGSEYFSVKNNQSISKSTIKFLKSSKRFDDSLFLKKRKTRTLNYYYCVLVANINLFLPCICTGIINNGR